VTKEFDDDDELKDADVIQTARELVNAFVMSAVPLDNIEVYRLVTSVGRSLDPFLLERTGKASVTTFKGGNHPPILYPMVDVTLQGVPPAVRALTGEIRDVVNTRRLGLPGDRLMLCCDEEFYRSFIEPPSLLSFIQYIRNSPVRWASYAPGRIGLGVLNAVEDASDIVDFGKAIGASSFTPLVDWSKKNPAQAVLIGVAVVAVSALAFWALPALLTELAALEATTLAATSVGASQTFIETAAMSAGMMQEATALELASAAQVELDAAIMSAADQAAVNAIRAEAFAVGSATGVTTASGAALTMEQMLLRQAMTTISKRVVQEILKASTIKLVVSAGIGTTVYLVACFN
jgi:hypothetical protein